MSMFLRRFTTDPGNDVLLEIESVNVLDLEPPSPIIGIGTGAVLLVGEFENGPYETPTDVSSADDLSSMFGVLGYQYGTSVGNNPCARVRHADSALASEYWNGNAFVQMSGKKFARLIVCRVNTSIGQVTFTPALFLTGSVSAFRYTAAPGDVLAVNTGAGNFSSTIAATAATVTAVGGVYPTTFAGGETLTLGYDGADNFTTTFQAGDQSNVQAAARINTYAGFTMVDVTGGQIRLTGLQKGTGGQVRVVGASAGVLAKLGLTAATTAGTGNVANTNAISAAEIQAMVRAVDASLAAVVVEQDAGSKLRMSAPGSTVLTIAPATTATGLGFSAGQTGAKATSGKLPAGTLVRDTGATHTFVTAQDITLDAASTSYAAPVRHALDDGTGTGANAGTITVMGSTPAVGAFTVTNLQAIGAAMTEGQIDAAYQSALDATLDLGSVAKLANILWCARQSNAVRRAVRSNVVSASANGMLGRFGCIRPPMNTPKAAAKSGTTEPGVAAYRSERVGYCYPQLSTMVPYIAKVGTAGGAGFTADGVVDVGADGWLATVLSQLNPEEDPGQQTTFLDNVNGLESGANAKKFTEPDYTAFKAAGIIAPRIDDDGTFFQSGITSVDPGVDSGLVTIARRRMADYIEDSLARAAKKYGKKNNTIQRRQSIVSDIRHWLDSLKGDPSTSGGSVQRIDDYSVDEKSGNKDPDLLGRGLYRIIIRVRTLSSLRSIVLACIIGETVTIEALPAAA